MFLRLKSWKSWVNATIVVISLILLYVGVSWAQTGSASAAQENNPDIIRVIYGGNLRSSIEPCG